MNLDMRRKKALYRANHRGTKEMDLILGRFANAHIVHLDADELCQFEALLDVPDTQMQKWFLGQAEVPAAFDTVVFSRIKHHLGTS